MEARKCSAVVQTANGKQLTQLGGASSGLAPCRLWKGTRKTVLTEEERSGAGLGKQRVKNVLGDSGTISDCAKGDLLVNIADRTYYGHATRIDRRGQL